MWLTDRERRFLLRGPVLAAGALVGVALWWWSPASPAALERALAPAARGRPADAVEALDALARSPLAPEATRRAALWAEVDVAEAALDEPGRVDTLLAEYAARWPDAPRAAEALARRAALHDHVFERPAEASRLYERAARLSAAGAGRLLVRAAEAAVRGGERERAEALLLEATGHAEAALDAWLALGRLRLPGDPAGAYEAYDAALRLAAGGPEAPIARLGLVTALERMERRGEALAELDAAIEEGEADSALVRRRARLERLR